jgi:hypothetical protein
MLLHIIETHNTLEDKKFSLLSIGLLTMTFIIFSYDQSFVEHRKTLVHNSKHKSHLPHISGSNLHIEKMCRLYYY